MLILMCSVSAAIHMFFDCMALGVGLFASVMATWKPNSEFTYGCVKSFHSSISLTCLPDLSFHDLQLRPGRDAVGVCERGFPDPDLHLHRLRGPAADVSASFFRPTTDCS